MKIDKRIGVIAAIALFATVSAVIAVADPMKWFPREPETRMTSSFEMEGFECFLYESVWDDGAAEVRIVPKSYDRPADRLPATGEIRVAVGKIGRAHV